MLTNSITTGEANFWLWIYWVNLDSLFNFAMYSSFVLKLKLHASNIEEL